MRDDLEIRDLDGVDVGVDLEGFVGDGVVSGKMLSGSFGKIIEGEGRSAVKNGSIK